jgi:hypothetical protein
MDGMGDSGPSNPLKGDPPIDRKSFPPYPTLPPPPPLALASSLAPAPSPVPPPARGLHLHPFQLNLNRFGQTSPCPPV